MATCNMWPLKNIASRVIKYGSTRHQCGPKPFLPSKQRKLCCWYSASIWGGLSAFASALSTPQYGVNLGELLIYPAVNELDNAITVTSTMPDNRLAKGSNFKIAVDIGLPVEILLTTGANAHQRMMSGSSFALPKLTAYVICIANAAPPNRLMGEALA